MDYHEEDDMWDTQAYPRTESYMAKRVSAYLFDLALSALFVIIVFVLLDQYDMTDWMTWLYIVLITAGLMFIMKVLLEGIAGRSFGKMFFGLLIVTPEEEPSTSKALGRNIFTLIPLVGPILDFMIGRSSVLDDRQKLTDSAFKTLVIEDIPLVVEEPPRRTYRPPMKVEPPKPKEKVRLDYRQMMVGKCPRCNAPYRILPPDDDSFSGLWNHRCTWCNHLITEDIKR